MREIVTVSIPREFKAALDRVIKEDGLSRSQIVQQALENFLFIRRYKALRARMMSSARKRGIYTDEDVFKKVS